MVNIILKKQKSELEKLILVKNIQKKKEKKKQVIQLSLEDERFIKEWDSVKSAMISLNIKHIDGVCRGERKSAGGYKWVYKEDYYARVNI